jgi:hypothetical protein
MWREIKRLSEGGELTAYRIVHFATLARAGAKPDIVLGHTKGASNAA